jgi:hypothetical protein
VVVYSVELWGAEDDDVVRGISWGLRMGVFVCLDVGSTTRRLVGFALCGTKVSAADDSRSSQRRMSSVFTHQVAGDGTQ